MSHAAEPDDAGPRMGRSRRRRAGLSIQSTVLLMLLGVSLVSNVLVGVIGYVNATDSLRDAAFERLVEVRESRSREISRLYSTIENTVVVHSRGQSVVDAALAFSRAMDDLEGAQLDPEREALLDAYYSEVFGPRLAAATGESVEASSFAPRDAPARWLQAYYTAPHSSFDDAIAVDNAGDGSAWSEAHARYHDYFRSMTELLDYEDVLLLDTDGVVVYSAFKGVDLGTNVLSGPYRFSGLSSAYGEAMAGNLVGAVVFSDFEAYPPSLNLPAGWAVTPIGADGEIVGAMAIELPIDRLNAVMTADADWSQGGLGETGDVYLVGVDSLMRSPSRLLAEDPDAFAAQARAAGIADDVVDRVVERGSTLGVLPARSTAVSAALGGDEGTMIADNYLGRETLSAFGSVDIDGIEWVIVAELDTREAFAPVTDFTRNLVLSSAVLALVVSVLSLLLARVFVRPLRRLAEAAQRIAAGETGVVVDAGANDEMASVSSAFNDMSRSLQIKAELLDEQRAESERLLRALMPEPVIQRYRDGDQTIAEDHRDVSVLYADIVGFDDFSRDRGSEDTLAMLNELVRQFDDAGGAFGVEHVRTTTKGYLASCGLTIPRVDHARRMVDFAMELERIAERYGGKHGTSLSIRAGIDTGTVTSGLVGQSHIAYDLWGDAVSLAFQLQGTSNESGIFLTQQVVDRMPDTVHVRDWGFVNTPSGPQKVWRIDPDDVRAGVEA